MITKCKQITYLVAKNCTTWTRVLNYDLQNVKWDLKMALTCSRKILHNQLFTLMIFIEFFNDSLKNARKNVDEILWKQRCMNMKIATNKKEYQNRFISKSLKVSHHIDSYFWKKCASQVIYQKNMHLKFLSTLFKNVHCRGPSSLRPCISRPSYSGFEQISTLFSYTSHELVRNEIWSIPFLKISTNLQCNMDNIKKGHEVGINVYGGQTSVEMSFRYSNLLVLDYDALNFFDLHWFIGIFFNIWLLQSLHFSLISIDLHFFGKVSHSPFNGSLFRWVDRWLQLACVQNNLLAINVKRSNVLKLKVCKCATRIFVTKIHHKFLHTTWLQLEDSSGPRAVVIAGLLRFSKTVFAHFHLVPINEECMILFWNLSIPTNYNWKMVLVQEQL